MFDSLFSYLIEKIQHMWRLIDQFVLNTGYDGQWKNTYGKQACRVFIPPPIVTYLDI